MMLEVRHYRLRLKMDDDAVQRILNMNVVDVNVQDKWKNTALIYAIINRNSNIVQQLIEMDADVNLQSHHGYTPLIYAVSIASFDIVTILLDYGVDVNVQTQVGATALIKAVELNETEIIQKLINADTVDINVQDKWKKTALFLATIEQKKRLKLQLVTMNADVNIPGIGGYTALMHACKYGNEEIVRILIDNGGADINVQNGDGETALLLAFKYRRKEIVRKLLNYNSEDTSVVDVCVQDKWRENALELALTQKKQRNCTKVDYHEC